MLFNICGSVHQHSAFRETARHNKTVITYNSTRPTTIRLPEYSQNYNIIIPAYLKGHIQHCTPDDGWNCHPKRVD